MSTKIARSNQIFYYSSLELSVRSFTLVRTFQRPVEWKKMEEDKTDAAGGRSADRFSLLWIHMISVRCSLR